MYLILYPQNNGINYSADIFQPSCTSDMQKVSEALKKTGVRVYKLDSLTEITGVDITYQEIPKELS